MMPVISWLRRRKPWQWQLLAHLAALLPLLTTALALPGFADPVADLSRATGITALRLLLASLLVRPLAQQWRLGPLLAARRPLGLWAFAWAAGHGLVWLLLDQQLQPEWLTELLSRRHLQLGALSLLLLLPLALTSSRALQRRLGRYWSWLHRSVYLIVVLAIAHLWLANKTLDLEQALYAALAATLLLWRLPLSRWWQRRCQNRSG